MKITPTQSPTPFLDMGEGEEGEGELGGRAGGEGEGGEREKGHTRQLQTQGAVHVPVLHMCTCFSVQVHNPLSQQIPHVRRTLCKIWPIISAVMASCHANYQWVRV